MIELLAQEEFGEMFSLMEVSFPKDEYRTRRGQERLFQRPEYQTYVVREEASRSIKGFICVWEFEQMVFVEHFAVNPQFRNGGLGSKILKEIQERFDKPLCLEVELPETELAARRIGFYERNGFFLNRYPYKQPPLADGQHELPLYLMTSKRAVKPAEFEAIRDLLYATVYQTAG